MNRPKIVKGLAVSLICGVSLFASAHNQEEASEEFAYPSLVEEQVLDSKHFRVHYTLVGEDAVDAGIVQPVIILVAITV